jgi:hypothetical protein
MLKETTMTTEKAIARLKAFVETPDRWRTIYDLAVSPDPSKSLAEDVKTVLFPIDTGSAIDATELQQLSDALTELHEALGEPVVYSDTEIVQLATTEITNRRDEASGRSL